MAFQSGFKGVLGGFALVGMFAFTWSALAQTLPKQQTRCEKSFGQEPLAQNIETCRTELTTPIDQASRVNILETLGKAYLAQGEAKAAITAWNEASQYISPTRENMGQAEAWTRLQVLIGQTHANLNAQEEAKAQFARTLEKVEQELGRYSLPAGIVQDALGTYYALQGNPEQAEQAFKRSRIIYEIRLGKTHPKTLETRMNYAVGLLDLQQEEKAQEQFGVLAEIINTLPQFKSEPIRAEILTFLGTLQMRGDDLNSAVKNYQIAYEVRESAFGPNDIRTSQSLNNLGVVLYRAGDLKNAERVLSRAYVIRKDALGEKDSLTLSTQKNLQAVIAAQNAAKTNPQESRGN
ncbi:MAG TPA: tetratricopeptide repeat protein [Limnobacter sp.]|nr:tetratricopeptide repeat protein [Limnobacter sp.]